MSEEQKTREAMIFNQELSVADLDVVAGGDHGLEGQSCGQGASDLMGGEEDADKENCTNHVKRLIYGGGGFANCGATVESGSWCKRNDACYTNAVEYSDTKSCAKAWQ